MSQVQFFQEYGDEKIVMLDAKNADFDYAGFLTLVSDTQMVDLHEDIHTTDMPTT